MRDSRDLRFRELSRSRFPDTHSVLEKAVSEGAFPGAVVGVWDSGHPDEVQAFAWGNRRTVPSPQQMHVETSFDLASVTKIFGTVSLTALLVQRGWLDWETSVSTILPNFAYPEIRIRHLLSHTAGFPAWAPFWERIRDRFAPTPLDRVAVRKRQAFARELVLAEKPEVAPGVHTLYSDISFLLLGFALEDILKMPLDEAVVDLLWKPMGIRQAKYHRVTSSVDAGRLDEVAATEDSTWRGGILQGQVHDDNAWAMGGYAAQAGAFGGVRDLMQFVRGLHSGFFTREVLRAMWTRVPEPPGCERTLGWDTPSAESSLLGRAFSRNSVGHWGFTGTSLWLDLDAGIAVALLTNRVHPTRENNRIREVRPAFHDALRADLDR